MNRFEAPTGDISEPETIENNNVSHSIEDLEKLRQQMLVGEEKQTNQFIQDSDNLTHVQGKIETEEENLRSIENLAKEKEVFFVHGIVDNKYTDDANKIIETNKLKWDEKLDVILGFEPTLSGSTVKPGSGQETHGRRGVIFLRGKALGGDRNDLQSVAHGLYERSFDNSLKSVESIRDAIGSEKSRQAGYNEIILEKPEVAGVYLNLNSNGDPDIPRLIQKDDDRFSIEGDLFDSWACIRDAIERETGIFVFTEGNKLHRIYDVNEKDKTFKMTPELSPEDIANTQSSYEGYVGQKMKKEAVMRVFDKISSALDDDEKAKYTKIIDE
jgi:hypothetical protein